MTWLFKTLEKMSPQLVEAFKDGLKELILKLHELAKATPNKWDDWAVRMIANVFGVDLPEETE